MIDLSSADFSALKKLEINITISTSTKSRRRYRARILDVAPGEKPWSSFLTQPVDSPDTKPKWIRTGQIEVIK